MKITPEQVIFEYYSGMYATGDFTPRVQSSAKIYDHAAHQMERSELILPFLKIKKYDLSVMGFKDIDPSDVIIWGQYCYGPDEHQKKNPGLRTCSWMILENFALDIKELNKTDLRFKMSMLCKMLMEDFKHRQITGNPLYTVKQYSMGTGIDKDNYSNYWKWKEKKVTGKMHDLSIAVKVPIQAKINQIKKLQKAS